MERVKGYSRITLKSVLGQSCTQHKSRNNLCCAGIIVCLLFAILTPGNASEVWQEDFASRKQGVITEFANVVLDNTASGGKAVELAYPGKSIYLGTLAGKSKLQLAGPVK